MVAARDSKSRPARGESSSLSSGTAVIFTKITCSYLFRLLPYRQKNKRLGGSHQNGSEP